MKQPIALALLFAWLGLTLLLGQLRWFRRRPLIERVRPYLYGLSRRAEPDEGNAILRILGPLARDAGAAVAKFSGSTKNSVRALSGFIVRSIPLLFAFGNSAGQLLHSALRSLSLLRPHLLLLSSFSLSQERRLLPF